MEIKFSLPFRLVYPWILETLLGQKERHPTSVAARLRMIELEGVLVVLFPQVVYHRSMSYHFSPVLK